MHGSQFFRTPTAGGHGDHMQGSQLIARVHGQQTSSRANLPCIAAELASSRCTIILDNKAAVHHGPDNPHFEASDINLRETTSSLSMCGGSPATAICRTHAMRSNTLISCATMG